MVSKFATFMDLFSSSGRVCSVQRIRKDELVDGVKECNKKRGVIIINNSTVLTAPWFSSSLLRFLFTFLDYDPFLLIFLLRKQK